MATRTYHTAAPAALPAAPVAHGGGRQAPPRLAGTAWVPQRPGGMGGTGVVGGMGRILGGMGGPGIIDGRGIGGTGVIGGVGGAAAVGADRGERARRLGHDFRRLDLVPRSPTSGRRPPARARLAAPAGAAPLAAAASAAATAAFSQSSATVTPGPAATVAPGPAAMVAPGPAATAAPIQRAIDDRALRAAHERNTLPDLPAALLEQVGAFNEADQDETAGEEDLHGRFARLHAIETQANAHLRAARGDVGDEDRQALFGLLSQVEEHQARLTRRTLETNAPLWLPDTVGGADRDEAHRLWGSISGGHGNIQIEPSAEGGEAFRHQTLASVGKLLQGKHGRGLLGELDAPQQGAERGVVISDNHRERFERIREEYEGGSWAHPMGEGSLAQAPGTDHEQPGTGTGSWVQVSETPPATLEHHQTGVDHEPIFAPHFITLGHELGHARHNLRGTTRARTYDQGTDFATTLWTNPEEHHNITEQENPLRAEHGLAERHYHHTIKSAREARKPHDIRRRFNDLFGRVPERHLRAAGRDLGLSDVSRQVERIDPENLDAVDDLDRRLAGAEAAYPEWLQGQEEQARNAPRQLARPQPRAAGEGDGVLAGAGGFLRRHWLPLALGVAAAAVGGLLLNRYFRR